MKCFDDLTSSNVYFSQISDVTVPTAVVLDDELEESMVSYKIKLVIEIFGYDDAEDAYDEISDDLSECVEDGDFSEYLEEESVNYGCSPLEHCTVGELYIAEGYQVDIHSPKPTFAPSYPSFIICANCHDDDDDVDFVVPLVFGIVVFAVIVGLIVWRRMSTSSEDRLYSAYASPTNDGSKPRAALGAISNSFKKLDVRNRQPKFEILDDELEVDIY